MRHDWVPKKCHLQFGFDYRIGRGGADHVCTMDWEGGTIGAIVPAMKGPW